MQKKGGSFKKVLNGRLKYIEVLELVGSLCGLNGLK